jgi:hypothetical protein
MTLTQSGRSFPGSISAENICSFLCCHTYWTGWLKANANYSSHQCTRLRRLARAVDDLPDIGDALWNGHIGSAQADELARVRANPRCGDQLGPSIELLLEQAEQLSFDDARSCLRRWVTLADLDGAHADRAANLERRTATVVDLDGTLHLRASGGDAAGVVIEVGRRQRLFTGAARDAAKLMATTCNHPGCSVPVSFAHVDHRVEWFNDGATDPDNSSIACQRHNATKHRHYQVERTLNGYVIYHRRDGTPMLPVGRRHPDELSETSDQMTARLARERAAALSNER